MHRGWHGWHAWHQTLWLVADGIRQEGITRTCQAQELQDQLAVEELCPVDVEKRDSSNPNLQTAFITPSSRQQKVSDVSATASGGSAWALERASRLSKPLRPPTTERKSSTGPPVQGVQTVHRASSRSR